MLIRALLGFALLVGFVALGASVQRLRGGGTPAVRRAAAKLHWAVGVVAVAVLVLFAWTALQLVR